jgi:4-hydroxythreonine-4-phosphate dehydrogenase
MPAPRIAVAGLNPHAGEGGLFGDEEIRIIRPAVEAARAEGIDASGPYAPDTVFMRARRGEFDLVVAMTHDHGLIPVKYLGVEQGVNVTLGLPFVRTSPDHGTAFDIAGSGRADASSLLAALQMARQLSR